jgi:hypothetical protein
MRLQGRWATATLLLLLGIRGPATVVGIVTTLLPSVVADIGGAAFSTWTTRLYVVAWLLASWEPPLARPPQE